MPLVVCADVGSTCTKVAVVDPDSGALISTGEHTTTAGPGRDVLEGLRAARAAAGAPAALPTLACSSAGGGLRLAVVGYEREVTAEAGRRVALTAGGRVVHVHSGRLDTASVGALRAAGPDVVLVTGGTDGGNADVLLHNAHRLGTARFPVPIVLAGNASAAADAAAELTGRGRRVSVAANVLPRIGVLEPGPARAAIRSVFLRHVIGGKGLSRGSAFARMVRCATPDAMLTGVEMLAAATGDVLVVDVGGATTDVYSVLSTGGGAQVPASGESAAFRTVEGDLGVRWSVDGVLAAAAAEGLEVGDVSDAGLAALAARIAVRRHGRPVAPGEPPRALRGIRLVLGSGGVLRHGGPEVASAVLAPLLTDHAGGWAVPDRAGTGVAARYVLFAAGLLSAEHPGSAARLAAGVTAGPVGG